MKINLKHKIKTDIYTDYVFDNFDIQNRNESCVEIENNIVLNFEWNIGVIYGESGSGKTTLLKTFGEIEKPIFDNDKSLISNFNWLTPKETTEILSAMGLSSVPCWLRPFNTLSNGEKSRAILAYYVSKSKNENIILVDEFTSVVDRDVAKAISNSLQKYIRNEKKKIILATCHFDIMEWLNPDWIYNPNKGRVERLECLRQSRPNIKLEIFRCRYETWKIFKNHHYLSDKLNVVSKCFIAIWNDKPVAFMATIPSPSGYIKNAWRCSRIVTLPDYQGFGIGYKFVETIAEMYNEIDCPFYIKTSHLPFVKKFQKSNKWIVKKSDKREFNGNGYEHWKRRTNNCYTIKYNYKRLILNLIKVI